MPKQLRKIVISVPLIFCAAVVMLAIRPASRDRVRHHGTTVIRSLNSARSESAELPPHPVPTNIAPLARVTLSSIDGIGQSGNGVADGVVDDNQWVSRGERSGAWIKLEWKKPVVVMEIDLYDRPSLEENVTAGVLIFDDGSMIPVSDLPTDGLPYRITFAPKITQSVEFRVEALEGQSAGLAEIMVFGFENP